ncbi:2-hydroxyacyl-CoA dehydratase family protein [Candidatus Omnitrophota bacterium]
MKIGFTSTIPVELIFAAGDEPVDLNNIFITNPSPRSFIKEAESEGFPGAFCSWVKGIYSAVKREGIQRVIVVVEGDCSNNQKLAEIFHDNGLDVFCFAYPHLHSSEQLRIEMKRLKAWLDVDDKKIKEIKDALDKIRSKLALLDCLSYTDLKVSGFENHEWLVSSSDFKSNYINYERDLDNFLKKLDARDNIHLDRVKLGYVGVPPIVDDMYSFIEAGG